MDFVLIPDVVEPRGLDGALLQYSMFVQHGSTAKLVMSSGRHRRWHQALTDNPSTAISTQTAKLC